jgi:hypothetical protein
MMKKLLLAAVFAGLPAAGHAAMTDCSTTIVTRGQAVTLITAANVAKGALVQNIDPSEAMWFSLTGTAAPGAVGSYILPPSQAKGFATSSMYQTNPQIFTGFALSVVAATPGHKISCSWW